MVAIFLSQVSITHAAPQVVPPLKQHIAKPEVRAFLDTIAWAEGTFNPEGYRTIYGYKYFNNFADHPRITNCKMGNGREYCSNAAGRYQFKEETWDRLANQGKLSHFGPANQDLAALRLISEKGALPFVLEGKCRPALYKVNKVWSSLPGAPYGQPTKNIKDLEEMYKKRLHYYRQAVPYIL